MNTDKRQADIDGAATIVCSLLVVVVSVCVVRLVNQVLWH